MVSSVFRISRSRVPYGTSVLYSDMLAAYSYILHQTTGRLSTPMSNGRWRNHRQPSRTLARTLWPGQNPVGQMITTDGGTAGGGGCGRAPPPRGGVFLKKFFPRPGVLKFLH